MFLETVKLLDILQHTHGWTSQYIVDYVASSEGGYEGGYFFAQGYSLFVSLFTSLRTSLFTKKGILRSFTIRSQHHLDTFRDAVMAE